MKAERRFKHDLAAAGFKHTGDDPVLRLQQSSERMMISGAMSHTMAPASDRLPFQPRSGGAGWYIGVIPGGSAFKTIRKR
jgi:hypothetical protein